MNDFSGKRRRKASRKFKKKRKRPAGGLKDFLRRSMAAVLFWMKVFLAVPLVYTCWIFITTAPYFALSEISISGNGRVPAGKILEAAGIEKGINIFTFNMREAGRRIEEIPWIRRVHIEREFPDTIRIRVVERRPVAMIEVGGFYYVDEEGYIFAAADSVSGWDYPVLTGIDKESLLEGEEETFFLLARGLSLIRMLAVREGRLTWNDISEINLDLAEGVTIFTVAGGTPIHLGLDRFERKLDMADKVLADLGMKGIRPASLEADFDDRIVVRRRI